MTTNWVVFVHPSFVYFSLYHGSHVSTASVETLLTLRFSKQVYSVYGTVYSGHTALRCTGHKVHMSALIISFLLRLLSSKCQVTIRQCRVRLMVSIKFPLFTFDCVFIRTIFIQSNQRETPDSSYSRQLSHKHSTSERRKIKADDGIYNNINVGVLTQCFQ